MADLRGSSHKLAMLQYQSKSDSEIQKIMVDSVAKAQATTNVATLEQLLGEIDACKEILARRKDRKEHTEQAVKQLKKELEDLKGNWILSCPTAASPNGQLIAAVLEDEDGLTADEIGTWCEELVALPEDQLKQILSDLVAEGVLHCDKKGKYHLWQLCTGELYPDDPQRWLKEKISQMRFGDDEYNSLIAESFSGLMTPEDLWKPWIRKYGTPKDINNYDLYEGTVQSIRFALDGLVHKGILARYPVTGEYDTYVYDYPILGRKEGNKSEEGDDK